MRPFVHRLWALVCITGMMPVVEASAGKPGPASVPAALEIEVLDPGVDPEGNPAVRVGEITKSGDYAIDIPPVVLVHRYYYSGDRSFQGPRIPGGPSILVVNHPQTGERQYIPAQMMPGVPRVIYTKRGIEYDYGEHAVALEFSHWHGKPSLKYRSGKTWSQKLVHLTHWEQCHDKVKTLGQSAHEHCEHSKQVAKGMLVTAHDAAKTATLPLRNTLEVLPLGKILLSEDHGEQFVQKAAQRERQRAVEAAEKQLKRAEASLETLR